MKPELFTIPFTNLTVKGPGLMIAIGFIAAAFIVKFMSRRVNIKDEILVNAALISLVAGLFGARILHVIHYYEHFDSFLAVFRIWEPGRELLGGVIAAIIAIIVYLHIKKQRIMLCLDILAVALMAGIGFGRIGCLLEGCCYGKQCDLPWAVVFPYDSIPYNSQAYPDPQRGRDEPTLKLPSSYYGRVSEDGRWIPAPEGEAKFNYPLKPYEMLTEEEKQAVSKDGPNHCIPIHPTQIYSSVFAFGWMAILFLYWLLVGPGSLYENGDHKKSILRYRLSRPGITGALMLVLYGFGRIILENLRDDNPYEISTLTISQILSILMITAGAATVAYLTGKPVTDKNIKQ
jgi:phosphatidylglycerol---prolipoprotein diacylglyceryl transferase